MARMGPGRALDCIGSASYDPVMVSISSTADGARSVLNRGGSSRPTADQVARARAGPSHSRPVMIDRPGSRCTGTPRCASWARSRALDSWPPEVRPPWLGRSSHSAVSNKSIYCFGGSFAERFGQGGWRTGAVSSWGPATSKNSAASCERATFSDLTFVYSLPCHFFLR